MAKLAKLHIENFASIGILDIDFNGQDGKIVGQNRIGKTTILNAIHYLLTDKLLGGSANIPSIKPRDNTRAKVIVEGIFYTEEGEITIRKEFYEKWVRSRGSATEELAGHSTDYFINGAKQVRTKDFNESLMQKFGIPVELSGLDAYQLVINPFYMGETICGSKDWKLARKAIIDIIGDVTHDEIFARNKDLEIAMSELEAHQYDDAETKKAISGKISGYKNKTMSDEGLLQEYQRTISQDVDDETFAKAKVRNEQIDEQIAQLKVGVKNPYLDESSALNAELINLQSEYQKQANRPVDRSKSGRLSAELRTAQENASNANLEKRSAEYEIERLRKLIDALKGQQKTYVEKIRSLQEEYNSLTVDDTCPTCGQKLPEEKIQESINAKKAEILAEVQRIRKEAEVNKKDIQFNENTLQTISANNYDAKISELNGRVAEIQKELKKAIDDESEAIKQPDPRIRARIVEINERLGQIQREVNAGYTESAAQIDKLKEDKDGLQAIFSKRIAADNARSRSKEIREEMKKIGSALSDAEQVLWAVNEFVKTKLRLLDEHMASKFGEVRFQLIKENIKAGSYDEVCIPFIIDPINKKHKDVLFPDGSKSEQIYTGIQIIKAIRDAKGWEPLPILFDQGGELDAKSTTEAAYYAEAQIIEVKVEGNATKPTFLPFLNN